MDSLERKSEAVEPGTVVSVGVESTPVLDDQALDSAYKFYLVNDSLVDVTIRLDADGAEPGHGLILKAGGGAWEEDRYAGALCACHHGASGTVDLSLVIV